MLVGGVVMFLVWVVSDMLEEQLLGKPRRERQKAVKAKQPAAAPLPRAQVHRRRDMHAA